MIRPVRGTTVLRAVALAALVLLGLTAPASAHEERVSEFPPGTGSVPEHRTIDQAADVVVVCKPDSRSRISEIGDRSLRQFNLSLLPQCEHEHIQAAVDAVETQRTNIYVLPGEYREQPSWEPECAQDYDGGVVSYDLIVSCGEVINLVTVAGDNPTDPDIVCDNPLCDLQIEGTGATPDDTALVGGFRDGDWVKHNGIKADRADGFYLRNMAFELFKENAVYVHETDGYVIDDVVARKNDLYGILTFTSDHGLIRDCETYFNGDSGVYPGSAADVNAQSKQTGPLDRWAVEITGCNTHHNALGFSGTAGNSVYFHDNEVHHNGAGYVTDSFVSGHPGMPQDHAWLTNNRIFSNNVNYYPNVQEPDGQCRAEQPKDRGHQDGVVCPAFPVPVGTGVLIAGGNHNFVHANQIYDNWRQGVMLFWVPAAVRDDFDPLAQTDTSNRNAFKNNQMGFEVGGAVQPNGLDFWWDDGGVGNCWQDNLAAPGAQITHNATLPTGLPRCSTGSLLPGSNVVKTASLASCATFNRDTNPDPVGCDWMQTPAEPGSETTTPSAATVATNGDGLGAPALSLLALLTLGLVVRRRVRTS